ncbi:hypothetical protein HPB48_005536 [Haemaphysalis longicornis]|uniref:Uncharacterized protein n=1 Tax=Haemaphysalis longicornis TaxID=44386 RepID=A0A9J6H3B1_HAELO|nr:hypothetical protein HPB48_005536 [Haemaphysalis longicornis]
MEENEHSGIEPGVELAIAIAALEEMDAEVEAAKAAADALEEQFLCINHVVTWAAACSANPSEKRIWMHPRHEGWTSKISSGCSESRATFRFIVEKCREKLERMNTNMRDATPVEKRVAVGLYKLCSFAEDRTIALVLAVGRSSVNKLYREFCEAVVEVMEADWITMPSSEDMAEHIREFTAVTVFPQAVGAMDGCHFPVSPPKEHAADYDYINFKGW